MGAHMSLEDQMAQELRNVKRAERRIARDMCTMKREKDELTAKIKRYAREGDMGMMKLVLRQYLVTKGCIEKLQKIRNHMAMVSQRFHIMRSTQEMHKAIQGLTSLMKRLNHSMGLEGVNKIIMEFEMETSKSDTMAETMEDMLDDEIDEDEEQEIVDNVLEEIGLDISSKLHSTRDLPNVVIQETIDRLAQKST
jgi:charged multivesicular body protein 2A